VAFGRSFDNAIEQVLHRFLDPFWKAKRLLNLSSEDAIKRWLRTINTFVCGVIDRKIEQMGRDQQEFVSFLQPRHGARARARVVQPFSDAVMFLSGRPRRLSRFLLERLRDPGCFDNKYIGDIILNLVIARRDTMAGTLSLFLYELCRNHAVQDRIAEEVRAAATGGRDVGAQELVACPTEDAIGKIHQLHAALTETLSLYHAVPVVLADHPARSAREGVKVGHACEGAKGGARRFLTRSNHQPKQHMVDPQPTLSLRGVYFLCPNPQITSTVRWPIFYFVFLFNFI
jgi:cytochrome P450